MPDKSTLTPLFTQVDVTTAPSPTRVVDGGESTGQLLREVLTAQDRTNELLEELVNLTTAQHRARAQELGRWREANPELAENCREAAETLSGVQTDFLERLTDDARELDEQYGFGDFTLSEFIDRYGPRLAHLNGVVQALAQLGGGSTPAPVDDGEED
ncbi:MAG: hypothetical protein AAF743_05295 [Planctomycetota bacterium]